MALGATAVLVNVAEEPTDIVKEPAGGFDSLKAVLEDISTAYNDHQVRFEPSV